MTALGVAQHEARHAAAGLMLGVPLTEARVDGDGGGSVAVDWDLSDPDLVRRHALLILAGRIGDQGWPPAWPSKSAATRDERQLAVLAAHLGLDEKGWSALTAEAYAFSAEREFMRLEHALADLLEQGHVLDEQTLKRVHAIATREPDMEHKTMKATATTTDLGQFTAIAAAWSVDRQGEQIRRGAFAETIRRWRESGKMVPLHWAHRGDAENVIGSVDPTLMRERSEGLYVEGKLDLGDSETARSAWRSMKANRVGLSFGYLVTDAYERDDGVKVLTGLDVFEISIAPAPANADTRIVSMKSMAVAEAPTDAGLRRRCAALGIPATRTYRASQAELRKAHDDLRLEGLMAGITRAPTPEPGPVVPSDAELRQHAKSLGLSTPPSPMRRAAEAVRDEFLALMLAADVAQTPARPPSREEADLKRRSRETMLDIRVGTRN